MSSTNDTYHHLLVQTQPKSILKKSPSPKFLDSSMNSETTSLHTFSSIDETDKDDIDRNKIINNHVCILNDNQSIKNNNSYLSSIEVPLTTLTMTSNEIDNPLIRILPRADSSSSSSSSSLTSDDEQQSMRLKLKKNYRRQIVVTDTLSSSNDNDDRKEERSMIESKTTSIRSSKRPQKDMQLDEFMRKYQQYGGIPSSTRKDHDEEQTIIKLPINHHHHHYQRPLAKKLTFHVNNELINDDTLSLLEPIDKITLSPNFFSPLQLLFDVARRNQCDDDRRTKINRIRQYVEEQIGISSFLTMYKLIKSSQIFIDIQQKPFCHYANFIPHLCCLIILESEEQKDRLLEK